MTASILAPERPGKAPPSWRQSPMLPGVLLALVSIVYYALYIQAGFNSADDGNYAQIVYELFLGQPISELDVGYGFLWFKIGEAAFHLFGVDYTLARGVFFACILATSLLVYTTLIVARAPRWLAFAASAVIAVVPAFPPTAFYGLCVVMNVAAQTRLAMTGRPRDTVLAGIALALTFQIRPDFGYVFAGPLTVVLVLTAWADRPRLLRLAGVAAAAFVAAHIPGAILALREGYAREQIGQYFSYFTLIVEYGFHGIGALFGYGAVDEGPTAGSVFLRRPSLNLFAAPDPAAAQFAALVYLPLIVIGAFGAWSVRANASAPDRKRHAAVAVVILTGGVAALPHYFLFRPDLPHVANFMPGFVILAAFFAWQAAMTKRRWAAYGIGALVVCNVALYLWVGLTQIGTGSIAGASAMTARFHTDTVDVRVHPETKALLDDLTTVIVGNSTPDDPIVCVPYCPGVAFMAGRQLYFRERYVDDATPLRDPEWISRAIARTRERPPAVAVVMDWAVNGTERSRFASWAATYVATLDASAREKIDRPGMTIYLFDRD